MRSHWLKGECEIRGGNFIDGVRAESEFECFLQCSATDNCNYYTWFSKENEEIYEECFLFSSCENINSCEAGCYVGSLNCEEPKTTTTFKPTYMSTTTILTTTTISTTEEPG